MLLNGHKAPTVHRPLLAARVLSRLKARADADSSFWLNTLPSGHQAAVNHRGGFRRRELLIDSHVCSMFLSCLASRRWPLRSPFTVISFRGAENALWIRASTKAIMRLRVLGIDRTNYARRPPQDHGVC